MPPGLSTAHRFPAVSDALHFLNASGRVRHWSIGYAHTHDICLAAHQLVGAHILPELARQHRVGYAIFEHFPSDLPDRFLSESKKLLERDPNYFQKALRMPVINFAEGTSAAKRFHKHKPSPPDTALFHRIFTGSDNAVDNREYARLVTVLCTIPLPIAVYGACMAASRRFPTTSEELELVAAPSSVNIREITRHLREKSTTFLERGQQVMTLNGAMHNIRAGYRALWDFDSLVPVVDVTILTPILIQRYGAEAFCHLHLLFPENPVPAYDDSRPARKVRRIAHEHAHESLFTLLMGNEHPWTFLIPPRGLYSSLQAEYTRTIPVEPA